MRPRPRFICLNTYSSVDATVWEGCGIAKGWGIPTALKSIATFSFNLSALLADLLRCKWATLCSHFHIWESLWVLPYHAIMMDHAKWNQEPKPSFSSQGDLCKCFYHSNANNKTTEAPTHHLYPINITNTDTYICFTSYHLWFFQSKAQRSSQHLTHTIVDRIISWELICSNGIWLQGQTESNRDSMPLKEHRSYLINCELWKCEYMHATCLSWELKEIIIKKLKVMNTEPGKVNFLHLEHSEKIKILLESPLVQPELSSSLLSLPKFYSISQPQGDVIHYCLFVSIEKTNFAGLKINCSQILGLKNEKKNACLVFSVSISETNTESIMLSK